ncbi:hypothetical protein FIM12_01810 [SAR202 cluster bacterium AD-804-J14_MRT_500m]|nr:hypothetical protein [SAR202 cluster bacterium AD-804-J14_MRT_500m]
MSIEFFDLVITLSVSPHVFVEPFTPPLPLLFSLIASGLAVVVSFVLVGFFARNPQAFSDYPKINLFRWKATRFFSAFGWLFAIQFSSVMLFLLLIAVGFAGNQDPIHNLSPTFVWVIWWVGLVYASAFVGDIWVLTNPWKILFGWAEELWIRLNSRKPFQPILQYPTQMGAWPALVLFLLFAWIENVYGEAVIPLRISQMILIYSVITWSGMLLFGKDIWLRNGEVFSVAFGFLARFSPTETRVIKSNTSDTPGNPENSQAVNSGPLSHLPEKRFSNVKELSLRPFASGLLKSEAVSASQMLFILVLLATVTFDGFASTLPWINLKGLLQGYLPNAQVVSTLGLFSTVLIFASLYLCVCALMAKVSGINLRALDLGRAFVYTLIPIALAYHVAHFFAFPTYSGPVTSAARFGPFRFWMGSIWHI